MKTTLSFAAALLLSASMAFAHADLQSAAPADGATVTPAPTSLMLMFTEDLDLQFTGLTLTGPDGKAVDLGAAALDPTAMMLTVPLTGTLTAGAYTVDWHALSKDGHKTKGTYSFTVK